MSIQLKPGTRLFGASCTSEFIVIKAPGVPIDLRIGGHPALIDVKERTEGLDVLTPAEAAPAIGKRYVDSSDALELLCTKAGAGALAVGDELCVVKDAKPLPASD